MRRDVTRLTRVLCAVDIGEPSHQLLDHALALARSQGARLLIVHAVAPAIAYNNGASERVELLGQLRLQAEAAGVEVRVEVQQGPADEIILLHSKARNVDLIVIGGARRERQRGWPAWIAQRVLRGAPCPTLIVPENASGPSTVTKSVLCAVDLASASSAVAEHALRLSEDGWQRVTLLHVANGRDDAALAKLQSLIPLPNGGAVMTQIVVGRPAAEILRVARDTDAQLLVIGAVPRSTLGSRLFGETGQLLRDATCPVLAVPPASAVRSTTEDVHSAAA
jgi:nucleotide-binding universal stress UspA family protein